MNITIIGHGSVGGALAKKWAEAGHQVVIGARRPDDDKVLELIREHDGLSVVDLPQSAREADVVLFATPATAVPDAARQLGELSHAIVIDATNGVRQKPEPYRNGLEAIKDICKTSHVAKCFNTTGYENMENPSYGDTTADMFVGGDSTRAKEVATQLAKDAGFKDIYDFGGDDKVDLMEEFAKAWINLAIMQGYGRDIAFKLIKRN
ncbi:MAG: NAD(P)-binding domain-containing protein [Saprospiraceae bacterium]|nr:NAD(P)-binding domain-containing protein [Saprospiraceae bacterium]